MKPQTQLARWALELQMTVEVIDSLTSNLAPGDASWKPGPDRWSILEVINHLADEEGLGFRGCAQMLLSSPEQDWPELHTLRWVESQEYNVRDFTASLNRFKNERAQSIQWLRGLSSPDWTTTHTGKHSFDKPMRAGDVMAGWIAHDYFHISQITGIKWERLNADADGFHTEYAGEMYWRPKQMQ
jgi:DinB superfamily